MNFGKNRPPSYKYLKVWGCLAKVEIPKPKKVKIGPKTIDCIFIGYAHNSSAYRFLVYKSEIDDIHENTIIESRNARFFEHIYPLKTSFETSVLKRPRDPDTPEDNADQRKMNDETEIEEPRRSKRQRTSKSFGPDFYAYMIENEPLTYQ